jgi:hypothetical protein
LLIGTALLSALPVIAQAQKTIGIGSCGTGQANCHVAEYKFYKVSPHNESLNKLYDDAEKAKSYGQKLGIPDIFKGGTTCMKCHSTVAGGSGTAEDGVTCEGCHGPGSDYKEPHQEGKGGGASRPGYVKSLKLGLKDLKNLDVRARQCVYCHYVTDQKLLATGHKSGSDFNYVSGMRSVAKHWKRQPGPEDLSRAAFDKARSARGPATAIATSEPPKPSTAPSASSAEPAVEGTTTGRRGTGSRPVRVVPPPPPPASAISEPLPDAASMAEPGMVPPLQLPPFPVLSDSIPIDKQLQIIKKRIQLLYQTR